MNFMTDVYLGDEPWTIQPDDYYRYDICEECGAYIYEYDLEGAIVDDLVFCTDCARHSDNAIPMSYRRDITIEDLRFTEEIEPEEYDKDE